MDENVREFLKQDAIKNGYKTDDATLIDLLTDEEPVWEGYEDERRWWTTVVRVVRMKADEGYRYFSFGWAKTTGDDSPEEKGWNFDPDTIQEVAPVTKMVEVTEYVAK
jgi:hypothetical protein